MREKTEPPNPDAAGLHEQRPLSRTRGRRLVIWVGLATAVLSLVLILFPSADIAVSRWFWLDGRFPAATDRWLAGFRLAGRIVTRVAAYGLPLLMLMKAIAPALVRRVDLRALMFLLASLAIGPGLLVTAILKEVWARSRPVDVDLFGGRYPYGAPWDPRGFCATDCSFPSAEASASFWLVALAFVVPRAWRWPVLAAGFGWTFAISLNRIAFGGHFLSDVLIAWSLTLLVILVMRELFLVRMPGSTAARLEAALADWGARAKRAVGLRP